MSFIGKNIKLILAPSLVLLLVACLFFGASDVYAQASGKAAEIAGTSCDIKDEGIASNIINCVQSILDTASEKYIRGAMANMARVVMATCTLALIFFAMRVAWGLQQFQRETSLFMIKILLVAAFSFQSPELLIEWRGYIVNTSEYLGDLVAKAMTVTDFGCSAGLGEINGVFNKLDCVMLKMLGINEGGEIGAANFAIGVSHSNPIGFFIVATAIAVFFFTTSSDKELIDFFNINSIYGWVILAIGFLFSGAGILIVLVAVLSMFSLIYAVVQALLVYITSMIAVTFLIGLTPIMLPLILFKLPTNVNDMVKIWLNHIFVYSLQPMLLTAFLVLTFNIMDDLVGGMDDIYEESRRVISDPTKPNSVAMISLPEEQVDLDSVAEGNEDFKELMEEAEDSGEIPPSSETETNWFASIDGTLKGVTNFVTTSLMDLIGGQIRAPHIEMNPDVITNYIAVHIATIVLLWIMISFMKKLPKMSHRMISKGFVVDMMDAGNNALQNATQAGQKAGMGGRNMASGAIAGAGGAAGMARTAAGAAKAAPGKAKGAARGAAKGAAEGAATGGKAGAVKGAIKGAAKGAREAGKKDEK